MRKFVVSLAVMAAVLVAGVNAQAGNIYITEPGTPVGSDDGSTTWDIQVDGGITGVNITTHTAEVLVFTYTGTDFGSSDQSIIAQSAETSDLSLGAEASDTITLGQTTSSTTFTVTVNSSDGQIISIVNAFAEAAGSQLYISVPLAGGGQDFIWLNSGVETPPPPVPEPSTFALLGLGGLGLAVRAYRRRQAAV